MNRNSKTLNIFLCLAYGFGYILMQIVVFYIAKVFFQLYYLLARLDNDVAIYNESLKAFLNDNSMLLTIIASAICIMIAIYIRKNITHEKVITYNHVSARLIAYMIGLSIILYLTANIIISCVFSDMLQGEYSDTMDMIFQTKNKIVLMLAVGVVGPIAEEYIFRGEIFDRLSRLYGDNIALISQGILFGLLHYEGTIIQITYALLLGIILGIIRKKSNGITAPTIVHMMFNSINFLVI